MSVAQINAIPQTEHPPARRPIEVHGRAQLSFKHQDNETSLATLFYCDPLKVLFPRGDVTTATLLTTGGGLFGGDTYDINVHLHEGAQSLVTAQAAEKVYRSSGPDCEINVTLTVAPRAVLEWLPQETILFNQARFRRTTQLNIAKDATALVGEMIVFGRLASGEEVKQGLLREAWEVRKDDKLIWADALHIDEQFERTLDHMSGFGGARAMATCIFADERAADFLEPARELLSGSDDVKTGASLVNGVLVCRWLAKDPFELRKAFGAFWSKFRNKALGRQANLPRLWQC